MFKRKGFGNVVVKVFNNFVFKVFKVAVFFKLLVNLLNRIAFFCIEIANSVC